MKVWLKRVLISLVVVFLVALVGVAIFLLTFDPNAYKSKLQEIVYARYERTLTINGDIELSLFPRIGLSVQDVSLSDRGNSDLFASVDSATLAVAIWPLMFNRLVVDHVAISGFQAWVVRNEEGEFNFDDLLSRRQTASLPAPDLTSPLSALTGAIGTAQAATTETAIAAEAAKQENRAARAEPSPENADLQIDIAGLTLRNGQIHLHDKQRNYVGHITGLEVNTGRVTADQPFDLAFRGQLLGDFPTADARFDGQALVSFNTDQKNYSAQRVNVQVNGQLAGLQARSLGLRGNLAYSAYSQMFSANGVAFSLQGDLNGSAPIKNFEATLAVPRLKLDRSQAELHVEKLSLQAKGEQ
ncbi:MAG: AsmA family protein, partial [Alcaligenaceae bacterium]|nr:AsmA family protein [Alcaligenaceae bacterium]